MSNIDFPKCSICGHKAKKRKLFLPIRVNLGKEDACICEACFFRLPDDFHSDLINNARRQDGMEFNTSVIDGLKRTHTRLNLNKGYTIFVLSNRTYHFERFDHKREYSEVICTYRASGVKVLSSYEDGRKIYQNNT